MSLSLRAATSALTSGCLEGVELDLERFDACEVLGSAMVRKELSGEFSWCLGGSGGEASMVAMVRRFEADCALDK